MPICSISLLSMNRCLRVSTTNVPSSLLLLKETKTEMSIYEVLETVSMARTEKS